MRCYSKNRVHICISVFDFFVNKINELLTRFTYYNLDTSEYFVPSFLLAFIPFSFWINTCGYFFEPAIKYYSLVTEHIYFSLN